MATPESRAEWAAHLSSALHALNRSRRELAEVDRAVLDARASVLPSNEPKWRYDEAVRAATHDLQLERIHVAAEVQMLADRVDAIKLLLSADVPFASNLLPVDPLD